jgi:hypothetical protein
VVREYRVPQGTSQDSWLADESFVLRADLALEWRALRTLSLAATLGASLPLTLGEHGFQTFDFGLLGTARWPLRGNLAFRFPFAITPSVGRFEAPRSFAIENRNPPVLGVAVLAGLGVERESRFGSWFVDTRLSRRGFTVITRMEDTRTGEQTTLRESFQSVELAVVAGTALGLW